MRPPPRDVPIAAVLGAHRLERDLHHRHDSLIVVQARSIRISRVSPADAATATSSGAISGRATTLTAVAGGLTFASVSAGFMHTCGLTVTGLASCWYNNESGALGNGSTKDSRVPATVARQP